MTRIIFCLLLIASQASAQLSLYAYDKQFDAGDTVTLDINVSGFDSITAYQWSIKFDVAALAWVSYETEGSALGPDVDAFGYWTFGQGCAPTVWTNPWGSSVPDGSYLYGIKFVALQAGSLSDYIQLQSAPASGGYNLPAKAWEFLITQIPVTFAFLAPLSPVSEPVSATSIQAIPNPCPLYTTIAFDATGVTEFTCVVTDLQGRPVKTIRAVTTPGTNELPITLPAPGMYLVAIKTKCATFVEKIVAQ